MDVLNFGKAITTIKRSRSQFSTVEDLDAEPLHSRSTDSPKKNGSSNLNLPSYKQLNTAELESYLSEEQKHCIGEAISSSARPDRETRHPAVVESADSNGTRFTSSDELSSIYSILDDPISDFGNEKFDSFSSDERNVRASRGQEKGVVNKRVLEKTHPTKVTPLVLQMAGELFGPHLALADGFQSRQNFDIRCDVEEARRRRRVAWKAAGKIHSPDRIRFVGKITSSTNNMETLGYESAVIDGIKYKAGDYVMMQSEDASENAEQDDLPQFGQITSLYLNERSERCFHMCRFKHGFETAMQELAGPHELFLSSSCSDQSLECIIGKIRVDFIPPGHDAASIIELNYNSTNHFFYRFSYDDVSKTFSNASEHQNNTNTTSHFQSARLSCYSCDESKKEQKYQSPRIISKAIDGSPRGFELRSIKYYLDDFVEIMPFEGKLSELARIKKIKSSENQLKLKVQFLDRVNICNEELLESIRSGEHQCVQDERHLVFTTDTSYVRPNCLEGKITVKHLSHIENLEAFKDESLTNFYVKDKLICVSTHTHSRGCYEPLRFNDVQCSQETEEEVSLSKYKRELFMSEGPKMNALELFAGAGFLSLGLHLGGNINTKWAIEIETAIAQINKLNFPETIVYVEDVSNCFDRATRQEGESERTCSNVAGLEETDKLGQPVHTMPRIGEVACLTAGFPCQGFSKLNRHPKANDPLNTMICSVLSYVDFYQPSYITLENVTGLLHHRLAAEQGVNKLVGGVQNGTMKFILRSLTCMGYQVSYAILQAAEFNTPQSRRRLIIWGARSGCTLPSFPQASTVYSRGASWHKTRFSAPHSEVTMADLITDLPAFEFKNPHNLTKASKEDVDNRRKRAQTIEQLDVLANQNFVGHNNHSYATQPLNEFQRRLRSRHNNGKVLNHVVPSKFDRPSWGHNMRLQRAWTEQICNLPLPKGAGYQKPPTEWEAAGKTKFSPGGMSRLGLGEVCNTLLTKLSYSGKCGKVIHPTQHRPLSVLEYARVSGGPDWLDFDITDKASVDTAYSAIGNGVPVPLGEAIGREFLAMQIDQFWEAREKNRAESCIGPKIKFDGTGTQEDAIILD